MTPNGGITWSPLTNLPDADVFDIETPFALSNILLVSTSQGIYKSTDGGLTWYQTYTYSTKDLKINPLNSDEVYGAVNELNSYQVIKSVDAGETWSTVLVLPDLLEPVSIDISNTGEIYVAIKSKDEVIIYKSIDGLKWKRTIFKEKNVKNVIIKIDKRNNEVFLLINGKVYKENKKQIVNIENE